MSFHAFKRSSRQWTHCSENWVSTFPECDHHQFGHGRVWPNRLWIEFDFVVYGVLCVVCCMWCVVVCCVCVFVCWCVVVCCVFVCLCVMCVVGFHVWVLVRCPWNALPPDRPSPGPPLPGASHNNQRTQTCTLGPRRFKHNSTRRPPEREEKNDL